MAYIPSKLFVPTALLVFILASSISTARPLGNFNPKATTLVARLKLDAADGESSPNCWESLIQLQSCTGEAILFFLNGETYLGHACCEAIRTISHQCWPDMLQTLGFTTEEGDILQGYCDHEDDTAQDPPPPPVFGSIKVPDPTKSLAP